MLALCREHRLEHRTKHIALRYFLACELQQRGQLRLAYVASEANTADIFTKALAPGDHQRFCTLLDSVVFLLVPNSFASSFIPVSSQPKMLTDVQQHVASCPTCQLMKSSRKRPAGQLQPIPPLERAWQQVTMDFIRRLLAGATKIPTWYQSDLGFESRCIHIVVSGSNPGVCTCRPLPLRVRLGVYGDPLLNKPFYPNGLMVGIQQLRRAAGDRCGVADDQGTRQL
ncbi:unnamed protein product [Closterium sp. NIES-54]